MRYPEVWTEYETMKRAAAGMSIARFGDGELSICMGGSAVSQNADARLQDELKRILNGVYSNWVLACIPRMWPNAPRNAYWEKYCSPRVVGVYGMPLYGSAFVTRPDNAPHIDCPEYWDLVRSIWRGRDVMLISGDKTL